MNILLNYYIVFPDVVFCLEKPRRRPHRRRPSTGLRSLVVRSTDVRPNIFQNIDIFLYVFEVLGIIWDVFGRPSGGP